MSTSDKDRCRCGHHRSHHRHPDDSVPPITVGPCQATFNGVRCTCTRFAFTENEHVFREPDLKLTNAEIARLAAAGIRYPWFPSQTLRVLDELYNARKLIGDLVEYADPTGLDQQELYERARAEAKKR